MKKTTSSILASCLILAALPAGAEEVKRVEVQVQHHGQGHHGQPGQTGPVDMKQHMAQMEMMHKATVMTGDRAIDMLVMGNQLMDGGSQKKDAKSMLSGARLALSGVQMHHQSMQGLEMIAGGLKGHVMHAKMGEMQIPAPVLSAMEANLTAIKKQIETSHKACEPEMAKIKANGAKLLMAGNDLILKGKAEKNAELMLQGNELMMMGIKLTHLMQGMHEGGHERKIVRMRRMMPGMDPLSDQMGMTEIEEEVIIRH